MVKSEWISYIKMIVYTLVIILFLIYSVGQIQGLLPIISSISIIAIGISLPQASPLTKCFSLLFLCTGSYFVLSEGISVSEYIGLFGEMLSLLSLFAIIPTLALPIQIGGYGEAVKFFLNKKGKTTFHFYRNFTVFSYFFAIFLNVATLPIMHQSIKSTVEQNFKTDTDRLMASSILQGYFPPLIWTPLSAVVGVVLSFTGVKWLSLFPILLLMSIVLLLQNWLVFFIQLKTNKNLFQNNRIDQPSYIKEDNRTSRKLLEVALAIFVLILLIITIDSTTSINLLIIATVVSMPFAFLWAVCIKKIPEFNRVSLAHFKKGVPNMHNLFAIFLSAGFFVSTLKYAGIETTINNAILSFSHIIPISLFLMIVPLVTIITSFMGLHPIVTITLVAQSLNPQLLGISPESLTIALLGGAVMTYVLGPFSGSLGLMSSLLKTSTFHIIKWNVLSVCGFYVVLSVVLLFIHH